MMGSHAPERPEQPLPEEERTMYSDIAVPLDGSAFGDHALPYAAAIANGVGGAIELLHVHVPVMPGELLEGLPQYRWEGVAEFDNLADRQALTGEVRRLEAVAERLRAAGVRATTRILHGRPEEALAEYALESGKGLIVMSTHGRGGENGGWLGSITDALVRLSTVPALLVRPQEGPAPDPEAIRFDRILVPVDGSPFSESILGPAGDLARLHGAEVTLFYAGRPTAPRPTPAAYLRDLSERLRDTLPEVRVRMDLSWWPARAIIHEADHGAYDLVAMATHGWGGLRHFMLGSTADKVLRGTRRPLLLFRPQAVPAAGRARFVVGEELAGV
jgi:nucleotide-binding universal stress UspA family protein